MQARALDMIEGEGCGRMAVGERARGRVGVKEKALQEGVIILSAVCHVVVA